MAERGKISSLTYTRMALGLISLVHGVANVFGIFGRPGLGGLASDVADHVSVAPGLIAYLVAIGQFVCGVSLLLGPFARLSALVLLVLIVGHLLASARYEAFFVSRGGCEYLLALTAMCGIVAAYGPGALQFKFARKAE